MSQSAVELFSPSQAPHLARLAAEAEGKLLQAFEALPTETLIRIQRELAAIAAGRTAFERFRRRHLKGI